MQLKGKNSYEGNIWKLYATNFLSNMQFVAGILILFFMNWGNLTFSQIMILESWFVGWIFILEIPTGSIADYFGRKLSLILSFITLCMSVLIFSSIPSFALFMLGEFIWALSTSLNSGTIEAMTYDTLKKINKETDSKKILSRLNSFSALGLLIASPIGSIIAACISLRACMLLMSIPVSIAIIIGFTLKEPTEKSTRPKEKYLVFLRKGIKIFKENKAVRLLTIDGLIISIVSYFMFWLYQPRLEIIGINLKYFGIINSLFVAMQFGFLNSYSWFEKIFHSKKSLLVFTAVLTGLGYFMISLTKNPIFVILGIIFSLGFGWPRIVLIRNYMNKFIETEQRATIISIKSMIQQFILMIINPFFGIIAEKSMIPVAIFLGIVAIGWSIVTPIKEKHLID